MRINVFTLHKDYTLYGENYQLVLPLDLDRLIPSDDSVRLLSQFIERMFLGDLYRTYCREGHENEPTPPSDAKDHDLCLYEPEVFQQGDRKCLPA